MKLKGVLQKTSALMPGMPLIVWRVQSKLNKIALTFDDGPNECTSELVNLLNHFQVQGTFFLIGQKVKENRESALLIKQGGHAIGNHTFSHRDIRKLNCSFFRPEVEACDFEIKEVTGEKPLLFRPPWGRLNLSNLLCLHGLKMTICLWSLDSLDYRANDANSIVETVIKDVCSGDVILFHQNKFTIEALPCIIKELKKKGFSFLRMDTSKGG
jgi:peptidoglycan/xylan/chitin deacetylase (PgdA/CDA1 family)